MLPTSRSPADAQVMPRNVSPYRADTLEPSPWALIKATNSNARTVATMEAMLRLSAPSCHCIQPVIILEIAYRPGRDTYHQESELKQTSLGFSRDKRRRSCNQREACRPHADNVQHRHRLAGHPERAEIVADHPRPLECRAVSDFLRPGVCRVKSEENGLVRALGYVARNANCVGLGGAQGTLAVGYDVHGVEVLGGLGASRGCIELHARVVSACGLCMMVRSTYCEEVGIL